MTRRERTRLVVVSIACWLALLAWTASEWGDGWALTDLGEAYRDMKQYNHRWYLPFYQQGSD